MYTVAHSLDACEVACPASTAMDIAPAHGPSGMVRLKDFVLRFRSELLMCVFVFLVLLTPLADSHPHIGGIIAVLILASLLAGASYMASQKVMNLVVLPLAGFWLIARILEALGDSRYFYTRMAPFAGLLLSCAVIWGILDRFDTVPTVTTSVLAEAFISYIVIAIAFSQVYWILNRLFDNCFNEVISPAHASRLLYFSMLTLATVGYGDILPVNPYVRLVAAFEGMLGVFFVAVIVARLVSSYRPRHRREGT